MKSIGISDDLPEYLKSKYSVSNPKRKIATAHKAYKPVLHQGVSEESPLNFKIKNIPVLNNTLKNLEISKDLLSSRFSSELKQNLPISKPRFDYSEIKSQKFDYDTLKFVEGIDVKAGNSARIKRAMPYSDQYSDSLKTGFGLQRGEFNVELSQPNVPRYQSSHLKHLSHYLSLVSKKYDISKPKTSLRQSSVSFYDVPKHPNTPNRKLKVKKKMHKKEAPSLIDLDIFDADIKHKNSLWMSTIMYKDF